ncbi:helix-turn-helix domain-containing protein [Eubacteriales bacterium OttesenSCG-928-A19]|nr:helix-turn-helix domain-containing protein [Eubacteriales bacterium OttesenSCG-928-A19]
MASLDYQAMGSRIRQLRKQHRLTQAELAERVGISTSFMGHIERGTRIASLETLVGLSDALNVSLDAMVTGMDSGPVTSGNTTTKMRVLNDVMRVLNEHSSEWLREE